MQTNIGLGYELYLDIRKFFSINLDHFDYEEKILMPELQRLLSDDEIKDIEGHKKLLPEQLIHMMQQLFPHMDPNDRLSYLQDLKNDRPEKFDIVWQGISASINLSERNNLITQLNINHSALNA